MGQFKKLWIFDFKHTFLKSQKNSNNTYIKV
jgi:hypothetical protein